MTLPGRTGEIQQAGGQHSTADVPAQAVDFTTAKPNLSSATPDPMASTARAFQKPINPAFAGVNIAREGMLHPTTPFTVGNNATSLGYPTDQKNPGSQNLTSALPKALYNIDKQSAPVSLAHSPASTSKRQVPRERRGTLSILFGRSGSRSRQNGKSDNASGTLTPKSISSGAFRNLGLIARKISISRVPAAQQEHAAEDGSLANRSGTSGSPLNIVESSEEGPNVKPSRSGFIEAYRIVRPRNTCSKTAQDKSTSLNLEADNRPPPNDPIVSRDCVAGTISEDTRACSSAIVPYSGSRDTNIADLPASDPVSITISNHGSQTTWVSHEPVSARRTKRVDPRRYSPCHTQRKKLAEAGISQAKHGAERGSDTKENEAAAESREIHRKTSIHNREECDVVGNALATTTQDEAKTWRTHGTESVERKADSRERTPKDTSITRKKRKSSRNKNKHHLSNAPRHSLRLESIGSTPDNPEELQGVVPFPELQRKGSSAEPKTKAVKIHGFTALDAMPAEKGHQLVTPPGISLLSGAAITEIEHPADVVTTNARLAAPYSNASNEELTAVRIEKMVTLEKKTKHEVSSRSKSHEERQRLKAAVEIYPNNLLAKGRAKNEQKPAMTDSDGKDMQAKRQDFEGDAFRKVTKTHIEQSAKRPTSEASKLTEPSKQVSTVKNPQGGDFPPAQSAVPASRHQPPLRSTSAASKQCIVRRKSEASTQAARRKHSVVSFGVDVKEPPRETKEQLQLLPQTVVIQVWLNNSTLNSINCIFSQNMALAHLEEMAAKGSVKRRRPTIHRKSSLVYGPGRVSSLDIGDQKHAYVRVNRFVSSGRCSRGRFACLLIVAGSFCLWRNRCEAVAAGRRRPALYPILERLYSELLSVLSEELFFLGEEEFLRHWSCPFVSVCDGRVKLVFQPAWYW
ncbi:hypothetical protein HPB51_001815 [Rhipicephalus microplus]|uniref:Uncharacterized protein n=1 Tax=Rhipicephalus microplus TaxID=6941 RepID=A0A9J6EWG8_RHIMP|nr:hypothetical protein HPB51_001815 [Rhipicephalus microplus]